MSRNHQSGSGNELLRLGILLFVGAHEPRGDRQGFLLGDVVRLLGGDDLGGAKIQALLPLFGVSLKECLVLLRVEELRVELPALAGLEAWFQHQKIDLLYVGDDDGFFGSPITEGSWRSSHRDVVISSVITEDVDLLLGEGRLRLSIGIQHGR